MSRRVLLLCGVAWLGVFTMAQTPAPTPTPTPSQPGSQAPTSTVTPPASQPDARLNLQLVSADQTAEMAGTRFGFVQP